MSTLSRKIQYLALRIIVMKLIVSCFLNHHNYYINAQTSCNIICSLFPPCVKPNICVFNQCTINGTCVRYSITCFTPANTQTFMANETFNCDSVNSPSGSSKSIIKISKAQMFAFLTNSLLAIQFLHYSR